MRGWPFPSRSRWTLIGAENDLLPARTTPVFYAICSVLLACAGPSWPGGIHAQLAASARGLRVVEVPLDSPAHGAGLLAGDAIVRIDDQPVAGMDGKRLHDLLQGEVGSFVVLTVQRDGQEHTLRVERAPYRNK